MQADIRRGVNEGLAAGAEFVLRLTEEIVERLLSVFERTRAAFDQTREVGWHQRLAHLQRTGLAGFFAQILCASVGQVDDIAVMQCARSFVGAEYDDFHPMRSFLFGPTQ